MRKTKRGGSQLSRKMKMVQPMVNEKYNDARKVVEYSGKQLKLDRQKQQILEKELMKVRQDEEKHRILMKKGQTALLEVLSANQVLSVMNNLVMMSDVKHLLSDPSLEHTLIFPTNENLLQSDLDIEKLKKNKDALNHFLKDYILEGNIHSRHLQPETPVTVKNKNGKELELVKKQSGKIVIKHEDKPVAVIVHKDLTHHDDSPPSLGNIHSIQDLETELPSVKDIGEATTKRVNELREGAQDAVNDARDTLKGATEAATNVGNTATKFASRAFDTITGLFGGKKDSEEVSVAAPAVGGGRRRRKRKTKKKKYHKRKTRAKRR